MAVLTFYAQVKVLLWKNFKIFSRKKKILLFMVLSPIIICMMLGLNEQVGRNYKEADILVPKVTEIGNVHKCTNPEWVTDPDETACVTVGYSIIGDKSRESTGDFSTYHSLMRTFASKSNLTFNTDVRLLTIGSSKDVKDYLLGSPNRT